VDKEADQILIDIVSKLQSWNPAAQGGRAVDSIKSIPLPIKKGKVILIKRK
jgi:hypothetical protein